MGTTPGTMHAGGERDRTGRRAGTDGEHYRGPDRRSRARPARKAETAPTDHPEAPQRHATGARDGILLAAGLTLLGWLALTLWFPRVAWPAPSPTALAAAEVSLAGVAAATSAIAWQVTGRRAAGQLAAGAALLATGALLGLRSWRARPCPGPG